jgi:vancomycin permeability regulator SanA
MTKFVSIKYNKFLNERLMKADEIFETRKIEIFM